MLILDAADVARLLPRIDALAEMRALFAALAQGQAVQPAQTLTLLPQDRGDFITYQGATAPAGVFGAKLSPYLPSPGGRPIITAWTLLMSMTDGRPLLLCDAARLTTERTAATTALAVDLLAAAGATRLAIIGAGPIAQAHWRHVRGLRRWSQLRVYSPRLAAEPSRLAEWGDSAAPAAPTTAVPEAAASASAAIDGAEVVLCCTSSGTPVMDPAGLARGALVCSVSTNVAQAHEVPPAFLNDAEVYCDNRATTPQTAGEMRLAARDHGWQPEALRGDLAELVSGRATPPSGSRPVFFRSVGLGLEDIAMAHALWRVASST